MNYKKRQKLLRYVVIFVLIAFVVTSVLATVMAFFS